MLMIIKRTSGQIQHSGAESFDIAIWGFKEFIKDTEVESIEIEFEGETFLAYEKGKEVLFDNMTEAFLVALNSTYPRNPEGNRNN